MTFELKNPGKRKFVQSKQDSFRLLPVIQQNNTQNALPALRSFFEMSENTKKKADYNKTKMKQFLEEKINPIVSSSEL
jgi:hypothetical protein